MDNIYSENAPTILASPKLSKMQKGELNVRPGSQVGVWNETFIGADLLKNISGATLQYDSFKRSDWLIGIFQRIKVLKNSIVWFYAVNILYWFKPWSQYYKEILEKSNYSAP